METARSYRLTAADTTGWMFGLELHQLMVCGGGVFIGVLVMSTQHVLGGIVVIALGITLGALRVGELTILTATPQMLRWTRHKFAGDEHWYTAIPVLGGHSTETSPLPDQTLLVVDPTETGNVTGSRSMAIIHNSGLNQYSASLRVTGRHFPLSEQSEQDRHIAHWGSALQGFINDRTNVANVRWSQWSGPTDPKMHQTWVDEHTTNQAIDSALLAYADILSHSGATATQYETIVTVTVNGSRGTSGRKGVDEEAIETLRTEIDHLRQRLESHELIVSAPLTPYEWARTRRRRLDPSRQSSLDSRTLGQGVEGYTPGHGRPDATAKHWDRWTTDDAHHRAYRVVQWPRNDVPADWMSALLRWNGAIRTIAVLLEPVDRAESQRVIRRDAAKIESDSADRAAKGFRVGAQHRRAAQAVEEREEELVAGYAEFTYVGIVVVTARSAEELSCAGEQAVQIAASCGVELRPLNGRHDLAMCATLP
jgi:hypothetical protein